MVLYTTIMRGPFFTISNAAGITKDGRLRVLLGRVHGVARLLVLNKFALAIGRRWLLVAIDWLIRSLSLRRETESITANAHPRALLHFGQSGSLAPDPCKMSKRISLVEEHTQSLSLTRNSHSVGEA